MSHHSDFGIGRKRYAESDDVDGTKLKSNATGRNAAACPPEDRGGALGFGELRKLSWPKQVANIKTCFAGFVAFTIRNCSTLIGSTTRYYGH
ncbi:MAG: hypothetical protein H0X02_13175 [Nitrosomonas sp.]|nr:hypothetical protein [Nitrosomonas sp.]